MADVIGLIGLGNMGSALAGSLVASGFEAVGYDIDIQRAHDFERIGGQALESPREVLEASATVLLSLPSAQALHSVISGAGGLLEVSRSDAIIIETSTIGPAEKFAARDQVVAAGMTMIDAPISGTAAQARDGDIVFYASGSERSVRSVERLLLAAGREVHWVGDFGSGTLAKLVSNLLVSVHTMVAAEALNLAESVGLDLSTTLEILTSGAGSSRMLEVRGPMMVERRYPSSSATVNILTKDVQLIQQLAEGYNTPTPLLAMVSSFFAAARGTGRADEDPAVLAEVYRSLSTAAVSNKEEHDE
ncbi:MAG: NAD-binding protein [Acidimicrobiia bacterium]|nr:NAD-binding protein [Acidimicrobiia bacterium]